MSRVWRRGLGRAIVEGNGNALVKGCGGQMIEASRAQHGIARDPYDYEVLPSPKVQKIVDDIAGLTLSEISDMSLLLKRRLRLQNMPVMPVSMGMVQDMWYDTPMGSALNSAMRIDPLMRASHAVQMERRYGRKRRPKVEQRIVEDDDEKDEWDDDGWEVVEEEEEVGEASIEEEAVPVVTGRKKKSHLNAAPVVSSTTVQLAAKKVASKGSKMSKNKKEVELEDDDEEKEEDDDDIDVDEEEEEEEEEEVAAPPPPPPPPPPRSKAKKSDKKSVEHGEVENAVVVAAATAAAAENGVAETAAVAKRKKRVHVNFSKRIRLMYYDAAMKAQVAKFIREWTCLPAKEVNLLIASPPVVIRSGVSRKEALKAIKSLKELGAAASMEHVDKV